MLRQLIKITEKSYRRFVSFFIKSIQIPSKTKTISNEEVEKVNYTRSDLTSPLEPCAYCGGKTIRKITSYKSSHESAMFTFSGYSVCECTSCNLYQINPMPSKDELDQYYRRLYRTDGHNTGTDINEFPNDNPWYLRRGASLRRLYEWYSKEDPEIIVDIGAGFGHVLYNFVEGFPKAKIIAFEPDKSCHQFLDRVDARIEPHLLDNKALLKGISADIVIMSHSLEHVRDLNDTLRTVFQMLKPKGYLIVEVPHCWLQITRSATNHSPHTWFFNEHSLSHALSNSGLKLLFVGSAGPIQSTISKRWPQSQYLETFDEYGGYRIFLRALAQRPVL